MNQKTKNLPHLDGWRGLAVILLLIGHFFPMQRINLGSFGVSLFFALSGLLMTKILFLDNVPIPTFYRRRISRIVPAMFVFLLVVLLTYAATGTKIIWFDILSAATFTTNYFPYLSGETHMPTGHIWSLSVEEHSYILLSALTLIVRNHYIGARAAIGYCVAMLVGIAVIYFAMAPADLYLRIKQSEVAALTIFASSWFLLVRSGIS